MMMKGAIVLPSANTASRTVVNSRLLSDCWIGADRPRWQTCDNAGLGLSLGSGFRLGSRLGLSLGLVLGS